MNSNISKLQNLLKIKIKNKSYFTTALTHKSANKLVNNEKLEFLGDRVIGLILSKKLFDLYPNEPEGILDRKFARLVNKKTCASIAWSSGIKDFIIIGDKKNKLTQDDEKVLSDACEAVIGAIYVDRGYNYVNDLVLRLWRKEIDKSNIIILDSKTKLQEYSLKYYKKLPIYKLQNAKGPKHNPTFKITVSISNSKKFTGVGSSKKQAELDAAYNLLKDLNIN